MAYVFDMLESTGSADGNRLTIASSLCQISQVGTGLKGTYIPDQRMVSNISY